MNKKKKKMDIVTKMSIIGVLGLVIALVVILAIACSGKKTKKKPVIPNGNTSVTNEVNDDKTIEYKRAIAIVKNVDISNKKLTMINVENENVISLSIDSAVDIKDEYGSLLTFVQLNQGDIVETKYDIKKMRPQFIHKTAKTWERKNIKGVKVDSENHTITIGNDKFSYTNELVTIFNGNSFDISDLTIEDEVTIKGYKDKAWTIVIENGHGYITLKNHSNFVGGLLEIGVRKTVDVEEVTRVMVPVGVHNIVVSKEGMTPYEMEVMVARDQEVMIDVVDASPRAGLVEFKVNQEGIKFSIGGEIYEDFSKPISLEYGTYNIKIVKDNYVDWEKQLVVDKPYVEFVVNLEKKPTFVHINRPEGVDIYIDGSYIGVIPTTTPIDAGNHTISLRKEGYYTKMHPVSIEDNGQDAYLTFPSLIKIEKNDSMQNEGSNGSDFNNGNQTNQNTQGNQDNQNNQDSQYNPNNQDSQNNQQNTPGKDVYGN
ncbi:MAG: PEGA domain-containing protein [Vallitalea sp.]|jgi:hypothetical protein|nr:PEGA domain-containing protein [Vallitalea sp.]